jgi:hypothetical protein
MAVAEDVLIDTLLDSKGMQHRDRICQTTAEQEFDLEVSSSSPVGPCYAATRLAQQQHTYM